MKLICVGAGRDGTLSVADMIQRLYDRLGDGRRVMHEYQAREFYHAFSNFKETNDSRFLDEIRDMIDHCPYDCIVGNGYAAVLPQFAERWGATVTLVHIRRADRVAATASLKTDCELFPRAYGYYSSSPAAEVKRMAAFHFGEMARDQWDELSLDDKIGWYYDKTHALVASHRALFAATHAITTESINDESTRRLIARLVVGHDEIVPQPTWLNSHRFDITEIAADRRDKMQWLLGRLNLQQFAHDDTHGIEYFIEKFVAWTGYQITGAINEISPHDVRTTDELRVTLEKAERIVRDGLSHIEGLTAMLDRDQGSG
jgi:hypothetical protein